MTDFQTKACRKALESIQAWLDSGFARPLTDTLAEVRLALATLDNPCPDITPIVGNNWVVARRTARITRQYGEDVVALSPARYQDAEIAAYAEKLGLSTGFVAARLR